MPLTSSEKYHLQDVTIVGMRFYPGAHDILWEESRKYDQQLYLVAEVDSQYDINAVMLHNGKQKLGSCTATEASAIKRILAEWTTGPREDFVVACKVDRINSTREDFRFQGSVTIHGTNRVGERLARKFADASRKKV